MDVGGLRNFVRAQLEVDDEELPDSILNVYLQEAFDRTVLRTNRWPYYESIWNVSKIAGQDSVTLPAGLNVPGIMSVLSTKDGYRLVAMNHETAEDTFSPITALNVGSPVYFSIWNNRLWLWPKVNSDAVYDMQLRGYRHPVWSNGASDIVDMDPRIHLALAYYAIALAYAAQEDEVLEGTNQARWDRDIVNAMNSMLEPVHHRPLVMHGGGPIGGVPGYYVNLPSNPP